MLTGSWSSGRSVSVLRALGLLTAGVLLMGGATGCGGDDPSSLSVPLTWRPTSTLETEGFVGTLPDSAIYVEPATDKRAKRDLIGENMEDDVPVPIYPSGEPAEFFTAGLKENLQRAGLNVVEDRASADRIVTADLNRFWVTETGTYKGEVAATVYVKDKGGQQLWKGTSNGTNGRWGRSLKRENYQEVYSDSIIELVENVLNQPAFRKALEKTSKPAAGGAIGGTQRPAPQPKAAPAPAPRTAPDDAAPDDAEEPATDVDQEGEPAAALGDDASDASEAADTAADLTTDAADDAEDAADTAADVTEDAAEEMEDETSDATGDFAADAEDAADTAGDLTEEAADDAADIAADAGQEATDAADDAADEAADIVDEAEATEDAADDVSDDLNK